jgi:hypothetical protein
MLKNEDFDWIDDLTLGFELDLPYNGFEYWISVGSLNLNEKAELLEYIKHTTGVEEKKPPTKKDLGFVVHCAHEDNDYLPLYNEFCFVNKTFEDDPYTENSIFIDGQLLLSLFRQEYGIIKEEENNDWLEFEPDMGVVLDDYLKEKGFDTTNAYDYFENNFLLINLFENNLEDIRKYYDQILAFTGDMEQNIENIDELQKENSQLIDDIGECYKLLKGFILEHEIDFEDIIKLGIKYYLNH